MMTQQQLLNEYMSLPDEARRQVGDFIAFLREKYKSPRIDKRSGSGNLEDESFVGMWRDREDVEDSSAWVRKTRTGL